MLWYESAHFLSLLLLSELSARVIVGSNEVRVEVAESRSSGVPEPVSVGVRDFCDIVFCGFALFNICCGGRCKTLVDVKVLM